MKGTGFTQACLEFIIKNNWMTWFKLSCFSWHVLKNVPRRILSWRLYVHYSGTYPEYVFWVTNPDRFILQRGRPEKWFWNTNLVPIGIMRLAFIYLHLVDFYGTCSSDSAKCFQIYMGEQVFITTQGIAGCTIEASGMVTESESLVVVAPTRGYGWNLWCRMWKMGEVHGLHDLCCE